MIKLIDKNYIIRLNLFSLIFRASFIKINDCFQNEYQISRTICSITELTYYSLEKKSKQTNQAKSVVKRNRKIAV